MSFVVKDSWSEDKQTIQLSGVQLRFKHFASSGPNLVFIHGLTDSSRSWSLCVNDFLGNYNIYIVDLRGHGDSSEPRDGNYSIGRMAEDVLEFMDAMKIASTHIIGHSMGSMIALELALKSENRVEKVCLISSTASCANNAALKFVNDEIEKQEFPLRPGSEFMRGAWLSNPTKVDEQFLSNVELETCSIEKRIWKGCLHALESHNFFVNGFESLKTHVLAIWGIEDSIFVRRDQDRLLGLLNAQVTSSLRLAKYGHNLHWENPHLISKLILAFFETEADIE
jgi:non-heme chloroperoxidase